MPSSFDGVESISVAECNPSAYPRRLTAETLGALRRRRTGSGSTVRKPLRPEHRREEGVDVSMFYDFMASSTKPQPVHGANLQQLYDAFAPETTQFKPHAHVFR